MEIPVMSRGVIATAPCLKNELVFDYHAIEVEGHTVDSYYQTTPDLVKPEYIIGVKLGRRRLIDASEDPCAIHRGHRCLARLANYAPELSEKDRFNVSCNIPLGEVIWN